MGSGLASEVGRSASMQIWWSIAGVVLILRKGSSSCHLLREMGLSLGAGH